MGSGQDKFARVNICIALVLFAGASLVWTLSPVNLAHLLNESLIPNDSSIHDEIGLS